MKERDTRQDLMIIQDGKKAAFGQTINYMEDDETYKMNLKITHGSLLQGDHRANILRPFDILTDGLPKSMS